jgi:rod shape-determining protein MreC
MSSRRNHTPHLAVLPGKHWFYRATLLMMVTLGLSLLIMERANNPTVVRLRTSITDAIVPVLSVAASPFDAISGIGTWMSDMANLRAENVALKNQNVQLLQWQASAKSLEEENRSLRELLNAVPARKQSYVTARVVSDIGGPYVHSALIDGGNDSGIDKDQAVISERGLAGRVVDAGKTSARVLLLTDINSRVPVIAEKAHEKAILTGSNGEMLTLTYLAADSRIEAGDKLVTSGDGGIFPPGIAVGIVTSVDKGAVTVQPFVDPAKLRFVSVVDYSL